jgi:hypothetical protein
MRGSQDGISNNPNGRPIGARNKRTAEIVKQLISNGFKDPLIVLGELISTSKDESIRATAANMLAPYLHGKVASIPSPIYLDHAVTLPHPNPAKLDQVRENIIYLTNLKLTNQIDKDYGDNLILDQRHLHDSLFEEMKLLYSQGGSTDVQIHIEGGLPDMPGTSIIKPDPNGNDPHTLLDSDHGRVDAPPEPTTIDSVANAEGANIPPNTVAVQPCQAGTLAKGCKTQNNAPAAAVGAAQAAAPAVVPNGRQPPVLKSQVPQRASDIKPEFRDRYLHERQLRFTHTYAWDGFLWIDSV